MKEELTKAIIAYCRKSIELTKAKHSDWCEGCDCHVATINDEIASLRVQINVLLFQLGIKTEVDTKVWDAYNRKFI